MFRALVELGEQLENKGELPPSGYDYYKDPIRWIVHLSSGEPAVDITASEDLNRPRPYSGRTSGTLPHLVADEAAYALGVSRTEDGRADRNATKKHEAYLALLDEAIEMLADGAALEALVKLSTVIRSGVVGAHPRSHEILAKDWVSFVLEDGPLEGKHIFELPEVRACWAKKVQELAARRDESGRVVTGTCAVCGEEQILVRLIPLNVSLNTRVPLHSLNASAFVSFVSGSDPEKRASIGICYSCGDTASRAFNHLSTVTADRHRLTLIRGRSAKTLDNHVALFWTSDELVASVEDDDGKTVMVDFLAVASDPLDNRAQGVDALPAKVRQARAKSLLALPWQGVTSPSSLDDVRFRLAVLSPNIGRVALREWIDLPASRLLDNLGRYRAALALSNGWRTTYPTVSRLFAALTQPGRRDTLADSPLLRGLLRCAYQGYPPPSSLLPMAAARFRSPVTHEDPWRLHALAAGIKLVLTHDNPEEAELMQELDAHRTSAPYLCGRLLAVIEKAQSLVRHDSGSQRGERSQLVDRFYGGAASTPSSIFPTLLRLVNSAYLPALRRDSRYAGWISRQLEEIVVQLDLAGGFPSNLTPPQQAEFALGFYSQRAAFRTGRRVTDDDSTPTPEEETV